MIDTSGASAQTVPLDSKALAGALEVLSKAASTFGLTSRERLTYRILMGSMDVALASFVAMILSVVLAREAISLVFLATFAVSFFVASCVGAVNAQIILKTLREASELKRLGLQGLSTSLWRAGPRRGWTRSLRSAVYGIVGILALATAILGLAGFVWEYLASKQEHARTSSIIVAALVYACSGTLFLATGYLRKQRERMDVAANAENLTQALRKLGQHADPANASVPSSVPSELVQQIAAVEAAQGEKERKDAILGSLGDAPSRSRGLSIAIDKSVASQRTSLNARARTEFEDILAELSAGGSDSVSGMTVGSQAAETRITGERVRVTYRLDGAAREIHIVSLQPVVKHSGGVSDV